MRVFRTHSEEETIAAGEEIARGLRRPAVVLLEGTLGAGKTTLAKGIVAGLGGGNPDDVSSPTFTLIHEYGNAVFHIDLYRLDTPREVASIGLDDLFDRVDAIILIEWGDRFPELMPSGATRVSIHRHNGEREIRVT